MTAEYGSEEHRRKQSKAIKKALALRGAEAEALRIARSSSAQRGRVAPNKGVAHSAETRAKISAARKGQLLAPRYEKICETCKTIWLVDKKQLRRKFCSVACKAEWMRNRPRYPLKISKEEYSRRLSVALKKSWKNPSQERYNGVLVMKAKKLLAVEAKGKNLKHSTRDELAVETLLWREGYGGQFDRQKLLFDRMVVDFYFPDKNKVVWVDGHFHEQKKQRATDELQERALRENGVAFLRIRVKDIRANDDAWLANQLRFFLL